MNVKLSIHRYGVSDPGCEVREKHSLKPLLNSGLGVVRFHIR